MCGVTGLIRRGGHALSDDMAQLVRRMNDCQVHRGPDDHGVWTSPDGSVVFGHRRLSIVDLSPAGHQPMTSRNGAWTITYNGELYNTDEVRSQLGMTASDLRGHSDTEVLVEAIAQWGVAATVQRVVGMFAFAAHHRDTGEVWLARDRFGEKPLYYTARNDLIAFASELGAVMALPGGRPDIDRGALTLLLRHGFVPAPHSILQGVNKLPAGHIVRVSADGNIGDPVCFWNPVDEALAAPKRTGSEPELVDELEELLRRTVASRTVSDVPLGAFLSGGIDSSLVTALMAAGSSTTPRTFTIGFEDRQFDESGFARRVAHHLGTDHTELIVSEADAMAIVPRLSNIYSEPFADSSQIPTRLVSELARGSVTVALSGDGGDELFGGYDRYRYWPTLDRALRITPRPLRSATTRLVGGPLMSRTRGKATNRARKFLSTLASERSAGYRTLMSDNDTPQSLVLSGVDVPSYHQPIPSGVPSAQRAMLLDTLTYLPEDLLTKVDRASMSVSLEVRVPLLDPEVFRFAWGLPEHLRVDAHGGKVILKQVLARHIPRDLIDRPKMGFGVPLGRWLSGPLESWASDLLDPMTLRQYDVLNTDTVTSLWREHRSGRVDRSTQLWPVLMFQAWLNEWWR